MAKAILFLFLFFVFATGLFCAVMVHFVMDKGGVVILGWHMPMWVEYIISFFVIEVSFPLTILAGAMFLHHVSNGRIVSDPALFKLEKAFERKYAFLSMILAPPLFVLLAWGVIETWFI